MSYSAVAAWGWGQKHDRAAHNMSRSVLTDGELIKNKRHYYDLARGEDSPFFSAAGRTKV